MQSIKIALPKGQLQNRTSSLLEKASLSVGDYREGSRSYRPRCDNLPELFLKVFHEKDIAIQVAIGNYDLGICRLDWIEELMVKFPSDAVVKLRDLCYGRRNLYAVSVNSSQDNSLESLRDSPDGLRIVSEYPNLAQSFALKQRFKRFRIFPVWGSAESYPPENAEIAIIAETSTENLEKRGMTPIYLILESSTYIIANRDSIGSKDLGRVAESLFGVAIGESSIAEADDTSVAIGNTSLVGGETLLSIALPDGHQQKHTVALLDRAGLKIEGYNAGTSSVRPVINIDGVMIKVIRPQDMPLQVANGNFDLAITGKDWLRDHKSRFPSSPVKELLDLGFGKVRIVAVVSNDMPVSSTNDLQKMKKDNALRVASEYVNIADKYTRDNHLTPCKIVPTWGATEAFLPEDADVLIENTETGSTIAKNNLKIIDTLLESTGCLIVNTGAMEIPDKRKIIDDLVGTLSRGIEDGSSAK